MTEPAISPEKPLDPTVPIKVAYRIPLWLRDEQIRHSTKRVVGRIKEYEGFRSDPCAIVCYGPSLNDTWEKLRDFKYIIGMSGSSKFLIARGIVPTWHTAVDPAPATVELIGQPHPDVEYIISSTCHPKVFDHLDVPAFPNSERKEGKYKVRLWHVFNGAEDAQRTLPPEEWALLGGSNVGLRSMAIARFFGFRELHVFGMDGSEGKTGKHAGPHPEQAKKSVPVVCPHDGASFFSQPNFVECARQTFHELNQLPDVKATFYGDGLIQHMATHYTPDYSQARKNKVILGISKPELISPEYRALNAKLHQENLAYGVGGGKHADTVIKLAEAIKTHTVLDYGAGKGYLAKAMAEKGWGPIWEYDPAFPEKSEPPRAADLVVCTDVLEHIEPEKLNYVLGDLRRCVKQVGFFIIHTGPSSKKLADGRNAHLIQQPKEWWEKKLQKFFSVAQINMMKPLLYVVVGAKHKPQTISAPKSPSPEAAAGNAAAMMADIKKGGSVSNAEAMLSKIKKEGQSEPALLDRVTAGNLEGLL